MTIPSEDTCFSLIEKLEPLFQEYREEQIIVALGVLLEREYIKEEDVDLLKKRSIL